MGGTHVRLWQAKRGHGFPEPPTSKRPANPKDCRLRQLCPRVKVATGNNDGDDDADDDDDDDDDDSGDGGDSGPHHGSPNGPPEY